MSVIFTRLQDISELVQWLSHDNSSDIIELHNLSVLP